MTAIDNLGFRIDDREFKRSIDLSLWLGMSIWMDDHSNFRAIFYKRFNEFLAMSYNQLRSLETLMNKDAAVEAEKIALHHERDLTSTSRVTYLFTS